MNEARFKAWQIVRLRGWPPHWHGSAWRIAAHIYRERSINLCEALAGYQRDIHAWEDAYTQLEAERDALKESLAKAEKRHGLGCECRSCKMDAWWDS